MIWALGVGGYLAAGLLMAWEYWRHPLPMGSVSTVGGVIAVVVVWPIALFVRIVEWVEVVDWTIPTYEQVQERRRLAAEKYERPSEIAPADREP